MSPQTHLLASWIVAMHTTDNLRDRRLVALAGVAPDLDGLGIFIDMANGSLARGNGWYYPQYHHWLAHGLPGAVVISVLFAALARRHLRVFLLAMLTFHLHLLCDLAGSRGPDVGDRWPIFYFGPLEPAPDVDLAAPMAAGRLAKLDDFPGPVCLVALAGGEKRRVLHCHFQSPMGCGLCRRFARLVCALAPLHREAPGMIERIRLSFHVRFLARGYEIRDGPAYLRAGLTGPSGLNPLPASGTYMVYG